MAITLKSNRQYPLVAVADFAFVGSALVSGIAQNAVEVPAGSTITAVAVVIDTVFDSVTSDVIDVTGGGTTAAAVNAQATGYTAGTVDGSVNAATTYVTVEWTGVGGSTSAGAGRLIVEYVIDERDNENQG